MMAGSDVSVLRMLLGDDYIRFEKDVILRSLEQLAEQGKLSRKTLSKIKLGLEHGESIPITEEALDYQSRNGRDGGAFLRVSIDLPDGVKLQNFVKVHSDENKFKNESSITSVLHESGSKYALPLFYVDGERNLMSTPFIAADSALSYFTNNPKEQEQLLTDCVDALFDTYSRARAHSKEIQPLVKGGKDAISRIKDIALPWLTGTKEASGLDGLLKSLKENYDKSHDDSTHVLIHGDPQLCNFLKSSDQVYLIDWEMARMGNLHQDIYRLLLRTGDDTPLRNSVLNRAFLLSKEKLDYTGDESKFLEQYRRFEIGEHLYVAGVFKDLSRSCHIDAKKALTEAANLYFNKSLRSARSLGLDDLAESLRSSSRSFNCTEMTENEYEYFDEMVSVSSAGFSEYFQQSMPASKEEVKSIKSVLQKKKRDGWFKKTAKALVVTAGIVAGMAVGGVGHEYLTRKPADEVKYLTISPHLEFESFPFDKFLNDPEIKKIIGGGYEEYRSSNRLNYLGYLGMNNADDVTRHTKLSPDQYLRLIWGHPKLFPKYFAETDRESVIGMASEKYGLKGDNVNPFLQLIWNNVKDHNFGSTIVREKFTGLPYEILDEIAGEAPKDGRTMEALIDVSAKYFRQLLEEKKLSVPEAIAVYYCGEDAIRKAKWAAYETEAKRRKIPPSGNEIDPLCKETKTFWKYCHHLPAGRGKELAIYAAVNSAYEHTSSFSDGCVPAEWEKRDVISRKYKEVSDKPADER